MLDASYLRRVELKSSSCEIDSIMNCNQLLGILTIFCFVFLLVIEQLQVMILNAFFSVILIHEQ